MPPITMSRNVGWRRRGGETTGADRRRHTLLNARDIAALNRARKVLKRLEDAAWSEALGHFDPFAPVTAWDLGRLSDAASIADDAIFHVLGTARTNCGVTMTDAQLFGTERAAEEAARPSRTAQPDGVPASAARPLRREDRPGNSAPPRVVSLEQAKREAP